MRKRRIIIVCAAIIAVLSVLAVWQRNNLEALVLLAKPEADLSTRMSENNNTVTEAVSRLPDVHVRELTDSEKEALRCGRMTENEAISRITGASASHSNTGVTDKDAANRRIAQLVAKVYVMRDTYISRLEGLKSSAVAEYYALPANEQTSSAKKEIAFKYIGQASALEAQCDGEITSILSEMTQLVDSIGGDKTVVSDVKSAYAEEKALKKAYYLQQYIN